MPFLVCSQVFTVSLQWLAGVYNDIAVASLMALSEYPEQCNASRPILVLDLDVHQVGSFLGLRQRTRRAPGRHARPFGALGSFLMLRQRQPCGSLGSFLSLRQSPSTGY